MMYKNLVIALLLGVSSQVALASEEATSFCETCTTDQQFMAKARSLSSENGVVTAHIFNMPNIIYKKYQVSKTGYIECEYLQEPDGEGGRQQICRQKYKYLTKEIPVKNQQLSDFTDYALAYNDAKSYFSLRSIVIPEILTGSAFDLVQNSHKQGQVSYFFNHSAPFKDVYAEKVSTIIGSASKIINNAPSLTTPPLVFKFNDNTLAYAVLDFVDIDGQYHFKFIKIQDGHNSLDLREKNPFTASYTFTNMSQTTWTSFLAAMKSYGLTVRGANESIIPTGTVTIVPICSSGQVCPHPN
ncbi:hypothetical protein [Shewanella sp. UCD-KL21]|uniref:hypothetical protein n=1 Tax=Shewanella sp. UCD-KL21 TaxID=1917164 RepID=UPI0009708A15|nr:hypothetical protein [Shewanella sp. UCD-KL21]